jgi:hypothetical protein
VLKAGKFTFWQKKCGSLQVPEKVTGKYINPFHSRSYKKGKVYQRWSQSVSFIIMYIHMILLTSIFFINMVAPACVESTNSPLLCQYMSKTECIPSITNTLLCTGDNVKYHCVRGFIFCITQLLY